MPTLDKYRLDRFSLDNFTLDKYRLDAHRLDGISDIIVPTTGLLAEYLFENNVNDTSGNARDATAYGTPTYAAGKVGNAISLDGATQYAKRNDLAPYFIGTSQFTVANWIKTTTASRGIWSAQLESGGGDTDTRVICGLDASGHITITRVLNADYTDALTSSATYIDNALHFVAVTFSGSVLILRVNNATISMASTKSLEGTGFYFGIGCYINATNVASGYLNGSIDQMRIYNRALSPAELDALYNSGLGI